MSRAILSSVFIGFFGMTLALPATAADYDAHPNAARYDAIDRPSTPYCGPRCGCPTVTFVRHRQLGQYYASGFDPREREEPRYSYGAVRTYARFERRYYAEPCN
jgi:hypothetical protein